MPSLPEAAARLRRLHAARLALLALLAGGALAALAVWWVVASHEALVRRELAGFARSVGGQVERRVQRLELGLLGARGLVHAVGWDALTREQFLRYSRSRDLDREFPGVRGIGLIRRVPRDQDDAYEAAAAADGWPGFGIRQLAPHQDERFVITYVEPVARNREAVGLDIGSEANRRQAALDAAARGTAVLTAPITLVQATGKPRAGFLLLLPVYDGDGSAGDPATRLARTRGWTYAPLVFDEVLEALPRMNEDVALRITDVAAGEVFHSAGDASVPALALQSVEVPAFGRTWRLDFAAQPGFGAKLQVVSPTLVGGVGSLLALLLAAATYGLAGAREGARELRRERERRAASVEVSRDAVLLLDDAGRVLDWNPGAQALFGHAPAEAIGRDAVELLVPPSLREQALEIGARVRAGEAVPAFDSRRLHRDGHEIDVSVLTVPMRHAGDAHDGTPVGLMVSMRDIRETRAAQRAVLQLNAELEHKVAERTRALETTRRDLQTVLDAVPSQIGYWDATLHNRFANRAYLDWFGLLPQRVAGMHARALLGEQIYEASLPHMQAALRGEPQVFEESWPARDGRPPRHGLVHYLPDIGDDGSARGMYVLVHDITELTDNRRRLAAALRESESLLETIRTHAIVVVTDSAGVVLEANEAHCRLAGRPREALVGQPATLVGSGTHDAAFWRSMWATIGAGRPWRGEICNRAADGRPYWVDAMIAPIPHADGGIARFVSIGFDVTDRRLAQQRLGEALRTLQAVLDASSEVSIIATDLAGTIRVFNRGAERLLGCRAEEVIGRGSHLRFHDRDEVEACRAALCVRRGRPVAVGEVFTDPEWLGRPREWTYTAADGRRLPVSLIITEVHDDAGRVSGYLGVAVDIAERRRFEQELLQATARAEAANAAKSSFLANMSHEIRSPLSAMLGLAYLLEQTALDAEQRTHVQRIRRAGDALLGHINDVLDLAKVEAGGLRLERTAFDPAALLRDVVDVLRVQAESRGLALRLAVDPGLPAALGGDRTRLSQVLQNLVGNAIKFTERGSVDVAAGWQPLDGGRGRLRLVVADTGIGIEAAVQAQIFEPFVQADASTTRRFGGTGLGLSIVRSLVEAMGGRITLDSRPGEGSQFEVLLELPVADAAGAAAAPDDVGAAEALRGRCVLVVDDGDINREVAQRILERHGARVRLAGDGEQALQALREGGPPVDLVLMDVHMPVLDGFEATRRLRAEQGDAAPPVIALTAGATPAEREAAARVGMADFLTKPFRPAQLLAVLARHLGAARPAVPPPAPAAPPAGVADADWPGIPGIDPQDLRERLGDDRTMFLRLAGWFFEQYDELQLPADAAAPSLAEAARAVHKLSGSAATLGLLTLHRQAFALEQALRDGDAASARTLLPALNAEFRRLRDACLALIGAQATPAAPAADAPPPLDREALRELLGLLRARNLRALAVHERVAPALDARLAPAQREALAGHLQQLRFGEAAALLAEV